MKNFMLASTFISLCSFLWAGEVHENLSLKPIKSIPVSDIWWSDNVEQFDVDDITVEIRRFDREYRVMGSKGLVRCGFISVGNGNIGSSPFAFSVSDRTGGCDFQVSARKDVNYIRIDLIEKSGDKVTVGISNDRRVFFGSRYVGRIKELD